MAKKTSSDPIAEKLDTLIHVTQDLLILQALIAGVRVDDVRAALKIDKHRVSNISKFIKEAKGGK